MDLVKLGIRGFGVPLLALASACATATPPRELVDAQEEFDKASASSAARVNRAGLYQAKKALDRANIEFKEHPGAASTRDFAYVALRRTQLAEVQTDALLADEQGAEADRELQALQAQNQQQTQQRTEQQLRQAQQELSSAEKLAQANEELKQKNQQLEAERRTRAEADKEAQEVGAKLAGIASVRQEQRGIVIAFPASALFGNGRSSLLPSAKKKLNQVADALADGNEKLAIEDHSSTRGSDRIARGLSERRAETIRSYLVDRGISPDRISSAGFGSKRVAQNSNAIKRSVEIVVKLPTTEASG